MVCQTFWCKWFNFFSEAINLFKNKLYYNPFLKTVEKNFKFDITYFVASNLVAMIAHKICFLLMKDIILKAMNKHKININSFEKDIIINLLTKNKNTYYKVWDFILGYDDINPSIISKSLNKLVKMNILEVIVSKPNKYKLKWNNDIDKKMESLSN